MLKKQKKKKQNKTRKESISSVKPDAIKTQSYCKLTYKLKYFCAAFTEKRTICANIYYMGHPQLKNNNDEHCPRKRIRSGSQITQPSKSPDFNPYDFSLLGLREGCVYVSISCAKRQRSSEESDYTRHVISGREHA